jgi:hypothetical protein
MTLLLVLTKIGRCVLEVLAYFYINAALSKGENPVLHAA